MNDRLMYSTNQPTFLVIAIQQLHSMQLSQHNYTLVIHLIPCLCLLIFSAPGPYQGGTIVMSETYSVVFGMEA